MTIGVLTALTDAEHEARVVAAWSRADLGVSVARRCVDLADLLAAAEAGIGRAAVVASDLRRLDREALTRLAVAGVAVVGVARSADAGGEQRLHRMGVAHVVALESSPDDLAAAVLAATAEGIGEAAQVLAEAASPTPTAAGPDRVDGRVVAVWGPTGAPGRSTVALGVAAELAELGSDTLLVDADTYGAAQAQLLGLLDEAPGLAAACRLANSGLLDAAALAGLAVEARPRLRVLTGSARADRWPEVRPSALDAVLSAGRELSAFVVVDCGFCLEQDEELSYDTTAPRRNGATLTALAAADTVLAVAAADPVGLQRYVRCIGDLADAVPGAQPLAVVNKVRAAAIGGGDARREIAAALERFAGLRSPAFVPWEPALDQAVAAGRTLAEVAPQAPARQALRELAGAVAGRPVEAPGRGRWTRARRRPQRVT